jgi:hypothetical protein
LSSFVLLAGFLFWFVSNPPPPLSLFYIQPLIDDERFPYMYDLTRYNDLLRFLSIVVQLLLLLSLAVDVAVAVPDDCDCDCSFTNTSGSLRNKK